MVNTDDLVLLGLITKHDGRMILKTNKIRIMRSKWWGLGARADKLKDFSGVTAGSSRECTETFQFSDDSHFRAKDEHATWRDNASIVPLRC